MSREKTLILNFTPNGCNLVIISQPTQITLVIDMHYCRSTAVKGGGVHSGSNIDLAGCGISFKA